MQRRHVRWAALVCLFFIVAASCSKPKTNEALDVREGRNVSTIDDVEGEANPDLLENTSDPNATGDNANRSNDASRSGGDVNPLADRDHARKVGSLIKPQSTSYSNPATWAGVTKDSIKFVFSSDLTSCGVNVINAIQQAGGNFSTGGRYYRPAPTDQSKSNAESRESIEVIVKYANEQGDAAADDFPEIKKVLDQYNKPGHPFYGRKIVHEVVDGGSYQCPEKTTAAAKRIAQEIKPFVAFTNDVAGIDGSGFNMANALHANAPASSRPMHFGSMNLADKFYKQWAPFTWTQFISGTAAARFHASWMCAKVVGKKAVNAPMFKDRTRVFGLAYPNNPNARAVVADYRQFLTQYCGKDSKQIIDPNNEFVYSEDPSRGTDEGTQMAVKFKQNGVTSVIYWLDLLGPLFHMISMKSQDFRPEFIWTSTAYQDSTVVQRLYDQEMVDKASFGISAFGQPGGFGYGPDDPFFLYHEYHKTSPNTGKPCDPSSDEGMMHDPEYCRAPGALVTWYYTTLPLFGGILFAGPDLKPQNVTAGLQAYPETRYGRNGPTDDPRAALVGAGPGQYHFITDASEWRWRSGFLNPPPIKKLGYVEWTDCQRHFKVWPNEYAPQWEPGSSHHSAWCGDAKYAPEPYTPDEGACADTPSGTCEKDNYPRWQ